MIQDQSKSNSERGKDQNLYLSEEAGLTTLLHITPSFEDCDWLVAQEGNKSVLLGSIISLHFEITSVIFPVLPYSLSHTDKHIIYVYMKSSFPKRYKSILFFFNVGLCLKKKREHATYDIRDSYYKPVAPALR